MTNIYLITNINTGRVYVGQTKRKVHTRFMEHGRDVTSALYSDMKKYGRSAFKYETLHICADKYAAQWERYYICKYNATNPSCGYNIVKGVRFLWEKGSFNPAQTQKEKERIRKYNMEHKDTILKGILAYNESRKFPVAMLDSNGNILKTFNSLSEACSYLNKGVGGTSRIKNVCDKFNKNGKHSKFFGYAWSAIDKGVQTTTKDVGKAEGELPSE